MAMESMRDEFLEKRLNVYDAWLENKLISNSSKVIPVAASFSPEQCVLPTDRVLKIVENARTVAVQNCECRSHYKRCDHPLEVCLDIILPQVIHGLYSLKVKWHKWRHTRLLY